MKVWQKNLILIGIVIVLAAFPLWYCRGAEFGGADDMAGELIEEADPNYEPWFQPIFEPASGEVESLLFALQAAIGSVPLAMGLSCGNLVLSVAVLGILITAPLGALGMDATKHRLLRAE